MRRLTAEDDLNDITQNGIYYFSTEDLPSNSFYQNASIVEVFGSASNTTQKIQRITRYGTPGQSSFRVLSAGNWLDWETYTMQSDILDWGIIYRGNYFIANDFHDLNKVVFPIRCYTTLEAVTEGLPSGQSGGDGFLDVRATCRTNGEIQNLIMQWTDTLDNRTWQRTQACSDGEAPTENEWTSWVELT